MKIYILKLLALYNHAHIQILINNNNTKINGNFGAITDA